MFCDKVSWDPLFVLSIFFEYLAGFHQLDCASCEKSLTVQLELLNCLVIDRVVEKVEVNTLGLWLDPFNQVSALLVLLDGLSKFSLRHEPVARATDHLWREQSLHFRQ